MNKIAYFNQNPLGKRYPFLNIKRTDLLFQRLRIQVMTGTIPGIMGKDDNDFIMYDKQKMEYLKLILEDLRMATVALGLT